MSDFQARVVAICEQAVEACVGTPMHPEAVQILARATGPLRVAIAGRVKAGKSTLLNALISERLAPTDAGECTFLVSEYREDLTYDVAAILRDGSRQSLEFTRDGGALEIDLGDLHRDEVDRLDVGWPSSALRDLTLIDTPGLASLTPDAQRRTLDFLASDDDPSGSADAVLYLMRHLHRSDGDFLETFSDRSLAHASPVNAIAVLSRADELGAGRPDAMESAGRVAARYAADPRVRALASRVVPVAGLLAETGLTLRQDEYAQLARIAEDIAAEDTTTEDTTTGDGSVGDLVAGLLRSVDSFTDPDATSVAAETRADLLDRLGLFGVRSSLAAIADGRATSGPALSRLLVALSGLPALTELLHGHFAARSAALKGRTALASVRRLAAALDDDRGLGRAVEELVATSQELGELRLVHLVLAGATSFTPEEADEVLRAVGKDTTSIRLGLSPDATEDECRTACLVAVDRWRTRRAHPMIDPTSAEACDLMARTHEGLYATLVSP